jgi:hypothetical protein
MAWTLGPRGIFPTLPPSERLGEPARAIAVDYERFVSQARDLARQATEKASQRERVAAEYEAKLGQAMLDKRKMPVNPLPDYYAALADLRHRSAGALRAAADRYAALGRQLADDKETIVSEQRAVVAGKVAEALDTIEALRPVLDELGNEIALLGWYQDLDPRQAKQYATASPERAVFDNAFGQVMSTLRRLRSELATKEPAA